MNRNVNNSLIAPEITVNWVYNSSIWSNVLLWSGSNADSSFTCITLANKLRPNGPNTLTPSAVYHEAVYITNSEMREPQTRKWELYVSVNSKAICQKWGRNDLQRWREVFENRFECSLTSENSSWVRKTLRGRQERMVNTYDRFAVKRLSMR